MWCAAKNFAPHCSVNVETGMIAASPTSPRIIARSRSTSRQSARFTGATCGSAPPRVTSCQIGTHERDQRERDERRAPAEPGAHSDRDRRRERRANGHAREQERHAARAIDRSDHRLDGLRARRQRRRLDRAEQQTQHEERDEPTASECAARRPTMRARRAAARASRRAGRTSAPRADRRAGTRPKMPSRASRTACS